MKKLLLFFVAIISCQSSFGQDITYKDIYEQIRIEYLCDVCWAPIVDDKTQDDAYEAPNSALTKKWYTIPYEKWRSFARGYIQFYPNGTLKWYRESSEHPDAYHFEISGTWKRSRQDLTVSVNFNTTKAVYNNDLSNYSLRQKDEIEKEKVSSLGYMRKHGVKSEKRKIGRLDDEMVLNENEANLLCGYYVSEEYIINKAKERMGKVAWKKAEEEKAEKERAMRQEELRKAEQEEQKTKELWPLNKQAYQYAYEGKFDEAISTIDNVIAQQPNNANWYDTKGEILYLKGDKDGAKAMWDKVIAIDPEFKKKASTLNLLMNYGGWQQVKDDFLRIIPFKKIRVKEASGVPSQYCCAFFTTTPNSNPQKNDTNYAINYFMKWIYNGKSYKDVSFKKCTDVGDGWFEYEFSQFVYFSHYQRNAPKDCLQILIDN